jgi:hypothetical protein
MQKLISLTVLVIVLAGLAFGGAAAQSSQPSSKVTAAVSTITILQPAEGETDWTTILSNNLKTPNQKDLFVDVSLECGLYTDTLVKSAGGTKDTAKAEAGVYVQVLVDDVPMYPGEVVFCRRTQTLTALFGGILNCTDTNGDGVITVDECTLTPEELELVLDTMNANSFNFVLDDLGPGVHTVAVQARISTKEEAGAGMADAKATIGKGSVTVESVRMIKNEDFLLE